MYKKIEELCHRKSYDVGGCLKSNEGVKIFTKRDRVECWEKHLEGVYSDAHNDLYEITY